MRFPGSWIGLATSLAVFAAQPLPLHATVCCADDPSGLDLRPGAEPLRVSRDPLALEDLLTWEALSGEYRVFQGDLDALHATGLLNDVEIATPVAALLRLPEPAGNAYFLVSSRCHPLKCSRGRDSSGGEREIPGCTGVEGGGRLHYFESTCLLGRGSFGVVRDAAEHAAFAACFSDPAAAPELIPGLALVYALDQSNAACGTCLEFTCVEVTTDAVTLWYAGMPQGDCDALHAGGPWGHVPDRPSITFLPVDPFNPAPEYCP